MDDKKIFRTEWPSGYMELNVGNFFTTSSKEKVNKLLRTTLRSFCTDKQRLELIELLQYEDRRREQALFNIGVIEMEIYDALNGVLEYPPSHVLFKEEKQLKKQREKLKQAIELFSGEEWA